MVCSDEHTQDTQDEKPKMKNKKRSKRRRRRNNNNCRRLHNQDWINDLEFSDHEWTDSDNAREQFLNNNNKNCRRLHTPDWINDLEFSDQEWTVSDDEREQFLIRFWDEELNGPLRSPLGQDELA